MRLLGAYCQSHDESPYRPLVWSTYHRVTRRTSSSGIWPVYHAPVWPPVLSLPGSSSERGTLDEGSLPAEMAVQIRIAHTGLSNRLLTVHLIV